MFERFTDRARRVVVLAQEEARAFKHNYIGTEHILLGLIHEGEGVAAKVLESLGIAVDSVRRQVEEIIGQGTTTPGGHIPFTPRAKKVLELSLKEALQLHHNYIGTEHLLLGLIREGEGVGAQVLVRHGADLDNARQRVLLLLSGYQLTPVVERPSTWKDELSAFRSGKATYGDANMVEAALVALVELEEKVVAVRAEKEAAVDDQEFERAASLRDEEKRVLRDIEQRKTELESAKQPPAAESAQAAGPHRSRTAKKVFISYRRDETRHIAGRMADWLTNQLDGVEIFVDVDSIEFGVDFRDVIADEVGKCDVLVAVIGKTWSTAVNPAGVRRLDLPDDLVRIEVESALVRSIRVIPVLVDDAVMPDESDLPGNLAALARRNALTIRHESFRQDILRLIAAVENA